MDVEKLISLVNDRKPLWDMTDKTYHMRDIQRKLWQEVAVEISANRKGIPPEHHANRLIPVDSQMALTDEQSSQVSHYSTERRDISSQQSLSIQNLFAEFSQ
ncbi:unnamed protein product [Psylliodes chrysocephalus]|uniref:MADF domain-containing protein n=1 Tax=Psylliodes chrysocephalus TaxID=3402493 RepID=A0A9P0GH35_9CUCU|nr:unnamed protein product [Psylliodes chrysocephala]